MNVCLDVLPLCPFGKDQPGVVWVHRELAPGFVSSSVNQQWDTSLRKHAVFFCSHMGHRDVEPGKLGGLVGSADVIAVNQGEGFEPVRFMCIGWFVREAAGENQEQCARLVCVPFLHGSAAIAQCVSTSP